MKMTIIIFIILSLLLLLLILLLLLLLLRLLRYEMLNYAVREHWLFYTGNILLQSTSILTIYPSNYSANNQLTEESENLL